MLQLAVKIGGRPASPKTHKSESDDPQVRPPTSPTTHKSDDHKSDVRKSDGTWNYNQNDTEYGT